MKKICTVLFLCLSIFTSYAQNDELYDQIIDMVEKGSINEAIKQTLPIAKSGDRAFQNLLGYIYEEKGEFITAVEWYKKSAAQKKAGAQFNIGRLYDKRYGKHSGITANDDTAKKWYWQAVNNTDDAKANGRKYALFNLFLILREEGKIEEGKKLLHRAVDEEIDLEKSPCALAEYYDHKDIMAFRLYRISAENGYARAQFALAEYFEEGLFVDKDLKEATKWYQRAADQGNWSAQDRLGECYERLYRKTLDERDLNNALKYYYKAQHDRHIIHLTNIKNDENGNLMSAEEDNYAERFYKEGVLNAKIYKNASEWEDNVIAKLALDSDVDVDIPQGERNTRKSTYVLVVANEDYEYEEYVPYASNDGSVFSQYCKMALGIPEDNVHLIKNAGLNKMKWELEWLKQNIDSKNAKEIIFYYSGHGMPSEDLQTTYLLPTDGFAKNANSGLNLKDIYSTLSANNIESYVILDACFSGTKKKGDMLVSSRGVAIKAKETEPLGNTITISACQGDETASVYEDQKHGMFTYFLLKELQKGRGQIQLGTFFDNVKSNVMKTSVSVNKKMQTPSILFSKSITNWKKRTL